MSGETRPIYGLAEDWRAGIREPITKDALAFIVCFSNTSEARQVSGQNAELALAVEQLRLRRPDQPWLIPVRFDDCAVPDLEIGGGRTLNSIQRVDLAGDVWDAGATRLVAGVLRIPHRPAPLLTRTSSASLAQRMKTASRDPDGDIALHDLLMPLADTARDAIADEERFPASPDHLKTSAAEAGLYVASFVNDYLQILDEFLEAIIVGCVWGHSEGERSIRSVRRRRRSGAPTPRMTLIEACDSVGSGVEAHQADPGLVTGTEAPPFCS